MRGGHRRPGPVLPPWAVGTAWTAAAVVALGGLAWTAWHGVVAPGTAAAFGALIVTGEAARAAAAPGEEREAAALVAAGALAYALIPASGGVPQAVALVALAVLLGTTRHEAVVRWPGSRADRAVRDLAGRTAEALRHAATEWWQTRAPVPGAHKRHSPGRLPTWLTTRAPAVLPGSAAGARGAWGGGPGAKPARLPSAGNGRDTSRPGAPGGPAAGPDGLPSSGGAEGGPGPGAGGAGPSVECPGGGADAVPSSGGSGGWADRAARRVLTTAFAATCFQPLEDTGRGPLYALGLLVLLGLTAACDAVLAAALAAARTRHPYAPLLRDELRALPGIGAAVCAGGVVLAVSVDTVGLWAVPVFGAPLLLTQVSLRRHAAARATYRQTIASLARCTEVAGYTSAGHARRVSALSRAVGRELGMAGPDLLTLEYAALMHDIGQLSLLDPVPAGATQPLATAEQRRIALLGGAVVRQTGAPEAVAVIVERQADPYREQPLAGRIVRTVNAYEDLSRTAGAGGIAPGLQALERLRLATAYEYDPRVVEALTRVVARAGH